jgi:membrane-associated phospholipid phosphatase
MVVALRDARPAGLTDGPENSKQKRGQPGSTTGNSPRCGMGNGGIDHGRTVNPTARIGVGTYLPFLIRNMMRTATRHPADRVRRTPSRPFPITVRPTKADVIIANAVARGTRPAPEAIARALTWGADEKVLLALATLGWIASRGASRPLRRAGNHALLVTVAASLLPHGLKLLFDQTRPDRKTVLGHVHGVSFSGKREDAFPSGHALHMGALASAAGTLPTGPRWSIRALAVCLSLTRVAVLAHWASDVVAGFALGAGLERLLRLWTGYPAEAKEAASELLLKPRKAK